MQIVDEKQFMNRAPTLSELVDGQSVINTSAGSGKITEYIKANSTIYTSDYIAGNAVILNSNQID